MGVIRRAWVLKLTLSGFESVGGTYTHFIVGDTNGRWRGNFVKQWDRTKVLPHCCLLPIDVVVVDWLVLFYFLYP